MVIWSLINTSVSIIWIKAAHGGRGNRPITADLHLLRKLSLGEKCCWRLKINDPEIHSILIIPCEFFWNITYREILGVIKRHSRWIYPHCELISAASVWQQNAVMEDKRTWTLTQSLLFYLPEQTRSIHSDITTLWTSQTVISGTFPLFGNDSRRDFSINFYLF